MAFVHSHHDLEQKPAMKKEFLTSMFQALVGPLKTIAKFFALGIIFN